jgi:hypothetical protein
MARRQTFASLRLYSFRQLRHFHSPALASDRFAGMCISTGTLVSVRPRIKVIVSESMEVQLLGNSHVIGQPRMDAKRFDRRVLTLHLVCPLWLCPEPSLHLGPAFVQILNKAICADLSLPERSVLSHESASAFGLEPPYMVRSFETPP